MQTYTTGKIAKLCEVAPRTVSQWIDKGLLRGYRIPGSQDRRVRKEELVKFLRNTGVYCKDIENKLTNTALVISQDQVFVSSLESAIRDEETLTIKFANNPFLAGYLFHECSPLVIVADLVGSTINFLDLIQSAKAIEWNFSTVVLARVLGKDSDRFRQIQSSVVETASADCSSEYLRDRIKILIHQQNDRIRKVSFND